MQRYSLATRTLWRLILVGVAASLLIIAIVGFIRSSQELERAHDDAVSKVSSSKPALALVLWNMDSEGVRTVLEGLVQNGSIISAEVPEIELRVSTTRAGFSAAGDRSWSVPLVAPNMNRQIGELRITESYDEQRRQFVSATANQALIVLLTTAGVSGFLFLIVYRTITRHLTALAKGVTELDPNNPDRVISLRRRRQARADELDALVDGINLFHRQRAEEIRRREGVENHLEELIDERTQALAVALQEAEGANRAKSIFLSNMSHELRTPLNAVIGFSRLMANSHNLGEAERKNLEIINRSGNHLLTLINDVLELSKIDAGRVDLVEDATDVSTLVREVVDMLRQRAEQAGLTLTVEIDSVPAALKVDAVKLRQILINLLGNAIKFTPQGGVTVRVRSVPIQAAAVQLAFEVRDTGIGIAPEDQQRIFEPFVQMVTHATTAGTGLGLTITLQYLKMLGSELTVESIPGVGSTFRFALNVPVVDARIVSAPTEVGRAVGLDAMDRGKRILIAEDNADARLLLQQLLMPLGFEVAEAVDGIEAIARAKTFEPDLILMDWRMPKLDGLEAGKRILAQTSGKPPKIVMLTASAFEEQRQEALTAGINDFLRKPLQENELYAALEAQLNIRFRRGSVSPTAAAAVQASVDAAALANLPEEQRAALAMAVEELNRSKLSAALVEIDKINPQLATSIGQMADAFRYKELLEMICGHSVGS